MAAANTTTPRRRLLGAGATLAAGAALAGAGEAKAIANSDTLPPATGARLLLDLRAAALAAAARDAEAISASLAADEIGDTRAQKTADALSEGHWNDLVEALRRMAAVPASCAIGLAAKADMIARFSEEPMAAWHALCASLGHDARALLPPMPGDAPPLQGDAELVRRCGAYIAAMARFEADPAAHADDDCPVWQEVCDTCDAAGDLADTRGASTLAGIRAMAEVARVQAQQADGSEDYGDSYTGEWPARVTRAVVAMMPAPAIGGVE